MAVNCGEERSVNASKRLTLSASVHGPSFGGDGEREVSGGRGEMGGRGSRPTHKRPLFHAHEFKGSRCPRLASSSTEEPLHSGHKFQELSRILSELPFPLLSVTFLLDTGKSSFWRGEIGLSLSLLFLIYLYDAVAHCESPLVKLHCLTYFSVQSEAARRLRQIGMK